MGGPGNRDFGQDLAPIYALYVNDQTIDIDITQFVKSVEFESALDMASIMDLTLSNPGSNSKDPNAPPDFTQHKAFQPGNEMELWGGYGNADQFLGRVIISRHLPDFPDEGYPTLTIKGYDKSFLMSRASGGLSLNGNKVALKNPRPADAKDDQGYPFINITPSDAVRQIAGKYGFFLDIDDVGDDGQFLPATSFLQRKGVTDLEICRMLANLNRKEMYVDYDITSPTPSGRRGWTFHWVAPKTDDNPLYVLKYNSDDASLMHFSTEYGLKDQLTEVVVLMWDQGNQRWLSAAQAEDVEGETPTWKAGAGLQQQFKPIKGSVGEDGVTIKARSVARQNAKRQRRAITGNPEMMKKLGTSTEFRLAASGIAIDVKVDQPFRSYDDCVRWATRWLEAHKDNFIIAHGTTVGIETLQAGQVHTLQGLGKMLDGDYYFTTVRHKFNPESGYTCDFTARRIVS